MKVTSSKCVTLARNALETDNLIFFYLHTVKHHISPDIVNAFSILINKNMFSFQYYCTLIGCESRCVKKFSSVANRKKDLTLLTYYSFILNIYVNIFLLPSAPVVV